jgi:hypothetical protein
MIDLNTLIAPSLGIQLLNAATINDRGEMAVVADFADGSRRPVLLIPCDAQQGDSEDCQDSTSLNTMSNMPVTERVARTPVSNNPSRNSSRSASLLTGPSVYPPWRWKGKK